MKMAIDDIIVRPGCREAATQGTLREPMPRDADRHGASGEHDGNYVSCTVQPTLKRDIPKE